MQWVFSSMSTPRESVSLRVRPRTGDPRFMSLL
jgi:hypothetical protein